MERQHDAFVLTDCNSSDGPAVDWPTHIYYSHNVGPYDYNRPNDIMKQIVDYSSL